MALFLAACDGSSSVNDRTADSPTPNTPETPAIPQQPNAPLQPSTPAAPEGEPDFTLALASAEPGSALAITEGAESKIGVSTQFLNGFDRSVSLSVEGRAVDLEDLSLALSETTIVPGTSENQVRNLELTLRLAVGALPIMPHQRSVTVVGVSGATTKRLQLDIDVIPVPRPDVYLLIGQSNMSGSSGGGKDAGPGGLDEPHPRIRQLNVKGDDETPGAHTSRSLNVMPEVFVRAEDPLHKPLPAGASSKDGVSIGPGLSFAKAALGDTTQNIILVPAAWGDTGFCRELRPRGSWNAVVRNVGDLSNETLLYQRALLRTAVAIEESGGILRGIIMHQGEKDASDEFKGRDCVQYYAENIRLLVSELRTNITEDVRGPEWRDPEAAIPFVMGTMSRGADERNDYSQFSPAKSVVDGVHRNISGLLSYATFANFDDLVPPGYPCGAGDCIHFGASAAREMGRRYYMALRDAVDSQ
ncbi:sialate O-acetylesterase [Allohahella marinimesophila]